MKHFVSLPVNGYLFWRVSRTASHTHCVGHCGRCVSSIKAVQQFHQNACSKSVLDSPKKQRNTHLRRMFCSKPQTPPSIMDFEVWTGPKLSNIVKDVFNFYKFRTSLENFSKSEFCESTLEALRIVTTLLSQFRFSELKGLLTPECMEEVERNLRTWDKKEASTIAFEPEHVVTNFVCDYLLFSDEKNSERKFCQVRMICFVWLGYTRRLANWKTKPLPADDKMRVFSVYNCRFIREVTSGVEDQWTINKINLKYLSDGTNYGLFKGNINTD